MALIDLFLARAVKRGQLVVRHFDGTEKRFGAAEAGWPTVTVRFRAEGGGAWSARDPAGDG